MEDINPFNRKLQNNGWKTGNVASFGHVVIVREQACIDQKRGCPWKRKRREIEGKRDE